MVIPVPIMERFISTITMKFLLKKNSSLLKIKLKIVLIIFSPPSWKLVTAFPYESLSYFSLKKETKTRTSLTRVSYTMETYDIDALCILSFLSISRHFQRRVIRYTVSYLHGTMFNLWNTKRIGLLVIVNLEESWGKVFPLVETFPPAGDLPFCSLFIFVAERCRRTL